jgi:hypothetical protein
MISIFQKDSAWVVMTHGVSADKPGHCIGLGATRTEALREAKIELQGDLGQIFQMLRASIKADRENAQAEVET